MERWNNPVRTRLLSSVGPNSPNWLNNGDLGLASSVANSKVLISKLGLDNFNSSSGSWFQVIYEYLTRVGHSSILNGLFGSPIRVSDKEIQIIMSKDMYTSSKNGAIMLKFVNATLAAGEKAGKIALPKIVKVNRNTDGTGVIITFGL